ncbi:MAG: hypothetical protein HFE78_05480 [Clostridiales bacterium]|nr:hypothetical protein [Clostridiales bacterium]
MKRSVCLLFALAVSLSLFACSRSDDCAFEAAIFTFDESTATLFTIQGKTILLNTGGPEEAKKILQYLREQEINRIDMLIISSFTKDCMGGAEKLIKNMEIGMVYEPAYSLGNEYVKEYYFALSTKDIMPIVVAEDMALPVGQGRLDLLVSGKEIDREMVNQTIVVRAGFPGQTLLYWPAVDAASVIADGHCDLSCDFAFVSGCDDVLAFEKLLALAKPRMVFISPWQTEKANREAEQAGRDAGCTVYFIKQNFLSILYKDGQIKIGQ